MITLGFIVVERFGAADVGSWSNYVAFSGLTHLTEIVGLDSSLSPRLLKSYEAEDWNHLAFTEQLFGCFNDLAYALRRSSNDVDPRRHQVLAVAREPTEAEVRGVSLENFMFMGFELIEEATTISALTNCGGFEGAFSASDLSSCGLVPTASRAYEIRGALEALFPEENHAHCAVWAVWRREPG